MSKNRREEKVSKGHDNMTPKRWKALKSMSWNSVGHEISYEGTKNKQRELRHILGISHRQEKRQRMKAFREAAP